MRSLNIILAGILALLALTLGALVYGVLHPSPTITLRTAEWVCTRTELHPTPAGKTIILIPRCVEYQRRQP
jgi:hypothetical protein